MRELNLFQIAMFLSTGTVPEGITLDEMISLVEISLALPAGKEVKDD